MRVFNQGAFYRVTFDEYDRELFAKRWPCCELPRRGSFTFQTSNDDLVEVHPDYGFDGPDAVAMVDDCKAYALKRLPPQCSICRGRHGNEVIHPCE